MLTLLLNFFIVNKRISDWHYFCKWKFLLSILQVTVSVGTMQLTLLWQLSKWQNMLHFCRFWGGTFCYWHVGGSFCYNYAGDCFCCNYAVRSFCSTYAGNSFCNKYVGDNFYCNYVDESLCYNYAGGIFCSALWACLFQVTISYSLLYLTASPDKID